MTDDQTIPETPDQAPAVAGILAEFDTPEALKAAAARVRDEGFSRWDVHTPYPVHGIERAMGVRPTLLPWLVMGAGIAGGVTALVMQWYLNATDYALPLRGYPLVISGKPLFSLPANIPVAFELIVLFSAFAAFLGTLMLCRLPQFHHPVCGSERFKRATNDRFFISILATDAKFDLSATRSLVDSLGPLAVEVLDEPAAARSRLPVVFAWAGVVLVVAAMLPPLLIARARRVKSAEPRIHLVGDMDFQPKYKAQAPGRLFADGRAMRLPVPGTVARGELDEDDHLYRGKIGDAWATTFPMPIDRAMIDRGRQRFNIYCSTCHGLTGDGGGMTAARALERMEADWATPVALSSANVRQQAVGEIFNTITNGVRKMPSYAAQIPVEDRWAIVLYVRALQRSQQAGIEDVPEERRDQLR